MLLATRNKLVSVTRMRVKWSKDIPSWDFHHSQHRIPMSHFILKFINSAMQGGSYQINLFWLAVGLQQRGFVTNWATREEKSCSNCCPSDKMCPFFGSTQNTIARSHWAPLRLVTCHSVWKLSRGFQPFLSSQAGGEIPVVWLAHSRPGTYLTNVSSGIHQ